MIRRSFVVFGLFGALALVGLISHTLGQAPAGRLRDRGSLGRPVYRVADQPKDQPVAAPEQNQGAHPLEPALQIARSCLQHIQNDIRDYSCMMAKRERIGGRLNDQEIMFIKVRHQPFSAYTYFMSPERLKGQEAIYVEGRNDGNLIGHGVGIRRIAGTVPLKPDSMMAMAGQRYPITEIGILNLTRRLIEVAEHDKQYGECKVDFYRNAKIDGRGCTCIQVVHPTPRKNFKFNMAQVFVDNEWNVPVRYVAYDWPDRPGGKPQLLEEYTYYKLKFNNSFTDADYDPNNPAYGYN